MSSMFMDKVMRVTFLLSLAGHLLFLGMPFNLSPHPQDTEKKHKELEIFYINIEKPPLLPRIDVMGEEKKLKEVVEKPEPPEPEPELEPQPEEVVMEQALKEPIEEEIEVISPAQEAMLRYQDIVKQRIEEARRYPPRAKRQAIEGSVHLNFAVLSNGLSKDIKIVTSSGSKILDREAVSTIQRANPFPPIPSQINQDVVAMELSIAFVLDSPALLR